MTIAKETAAFRGTLSAALSQTLPAAELAKVNPGAVLAAARAALEAGWPGEELARQALIGVAAGVNPGALLVAHLRDLATMPPPPVAGPTPPGRRAVITTPAPLPECAACQQPFRRGDQPAQCPACGVALRLVEFDANAALAAARAGAAA